METGIALQPCCIRTGHIDTHASLLVPIVSGSADFGVICEPLGNNTARSDARDEAARPLAVDVRQQ
jgi:hypothetical protein